MGRYNQRRRAASGPSPATAVSPGIVVVSAADAGGGYVRLTFASAPGLAASGLAGASFLLDGVLAVDVARNSATEMDVGGAYADPVPAGLAWQIVSQPSWASSPVQYPQSGLTL